MMLDKDSMNRTIDDAELRKRIVEELDFDPSINATHVGVAVEDGVVTLSGHVASYAEKIEVERAVRRIKGVTAIAEEIEVRFAGDKKRADDEIASRAVSILEWYGLLPDEPIHVTVQKGWVTLDGQVDWQFQKKAAEEAVHKLSGVVGIVNNIAIAVHVEPSDVQKKIEDALRRRTEAEARAIRVKVHDRQRVCLEGIVDSWDEREAAENAAWSVPGVQFVDNRLSIVR
jgi:osmotically-inducible protein OsmY